MLAWDLTAPGLSLPSEILLGAPGVGPSFRDRQVMTQGLCSLPPHALWKLLPLGPACRAQAFNPRPVVSSLSLLLCFLGTNN